MPSPHDGIDNDVLIRNFENINIKSIPWAGIGESGRQWAGPGELFLTNNANGECGQHSEK